MNHSFHFFSLRKTIGFFLFNIDCVTSSGSLHQDSLNFKLVSWVSALENDVADPDDILQSGQGCGPLTS